MMTPDVQVRVLSTYTTARMNGSRVLRKIGRIPPSYQVSHAFEPELKEPVNPCRPRRSIWFQVTR